MTDPKPPICMFCTHFRDEAGASNKCWNENVTTFDPVLGDRPAEARFQRSEKGQCGPEGKLFEEPVPSELAQAIGGFLGALLGSKAKESV
jgi:hypothetical protein